MIVSLPTVKVASGCHNNALNPVHVRLVESESYSSSASPPRYLSSTSFFYEETDEKNTTLSPGLFPSLTHPQGVALRTNETTT